MKLYFITKQFKARRMAYEEKQNVLWLDPNFKERFFKGHQSGFNLNFLRSIEQYPTLSQKVTINIPLVCFTRHLKDLKVAIESDEEGLEFMSKLKIPDIPALPGTRLFRED